MRILRQHKEIVLILALFLGLGGAYSVINPLFESPDEVWHYEYVRWLVEGYGLPRPEQVGTAPWHQEGSQPPLYYLAAALVTRPIPTDNAAAVLRYNPHAAVGLPDSFGNKNVMVHGRADGWPWQGAALAAHVARFFSLLLGALTVLSTYLLALTVFPNRLAPAVLAAALVAFNPQFLFLSAAVNNDNLVIAASALGLWLSVRLLTKYGQGAGVTPKLRKAGGQASGDRKQKTAWDRNGPTVSELLALGGVAGVAALAKLSGLALIGIVGLALLLIAWRRRTPFPTLVIWTVITGGATLAVAGWWYGRNLVLYGDPLGLQAMFDILPRRTTAPSAAELLGRAQGVWRSAWAVFGWFNVAADEWLYAIYTGLSLAGLAGLLAAWPLRGLLSRSRHGARPQAGETGAPPPISTADGRPDGQTSMNAHESIALRLSLPVIWMALMLLALISWAQMRYPQGRLLFPALSATAALLAWGLTRWLPDKLHGLLALLLATCLGLLAAVAPSRWIAPAYAAPQLLPPGAALSNPVIADFGAQVRLVGYDLEQTEVQPGNAISLTLYWQAQQPPERDYSIFVHLVDEVDIVQASHDSYPAAGRMATTDWPLSSIIPDRHTLTIPETAPAPGRLRIEIGVYDYTTGERLRVDGQDHLVIGYVAVQPRPIVDGVANPLRINFSDQIALIGFDIEQRVIRPGETLELTLWWEALSVPQEDYVVFAHLILPPDAVWAGSDEMPQRGAAPTSQWQPGQRIKDQVQLMLPANAPPGIYYIEIGLYDPATVERLTVNGSDAGISLGHVRVVVGQ